MKKVIMVIVVVILVLILCELPPTGKSHAAQESTHFYMDDQLVELYSETGTVIKQWKGVGAIKVGDGAVAFTTSNQKQRITIQGGTVVLTENFKPLK